MIMPEPGAAADYRISIRSLLLRPDERKPVHVTVDAETAQVYGLPCQALPTADGLLENRAGVLMLRYTLRCVPELVCDRCLSPVEMHVEEEFSHVIVTEVAREQDDAEYLLAPDAMLDLADVIMTDLRLSMPTKVLCRPDCAGLCPCCGKDRNLGPCGCEENGVTLTIE